MELKWKKVLTRRLHQKVHQRKAPVFRKKVRKSIPKSKKVKVSKGISLKGKVDIIDSYFVDFKFLFNKGLHIDEFLNKINCEKLCRLNAVVYGEIVVEFYDNLNCDKKKINGNLEFVDK